MLKLSSQNIYLAALEREHCRKIWDDFEYDFDATTELLNIGHSVEKSDAWFDEISLKAGKEKPSALQGEDGTG